LEVRILPGEQTSKARPKSRPMHTERRKASWRAYQRRRRRAIAALVLAWRLACMRCGHSAAAALDLHHIDPRHKEFALSAAYSRSIGAIQSELFKCEVLCANCHLAEHAATANLTTQGNARAVVEWRRRTKARLVALHGGRCVRCGYDTHLAALVFHHRDPGSKNFAISVDGVPRAWARLVEEAAKCDLLCANCHREVHAAERRA
jgi:hypothetical protein